MVKQLLAEDQRFALTADDELAIAAFPHRVARFRSRRLENAESAWVSTRDAAASRRSRRDVAEHLRRAAAEEL
jgi:hypothetical protein